SGSSSCAARRASPGCGASRAGGTRRAGCSPGSTAGSPGGLNTPIGRKPKRCPASWRNEGLRMFSPSCSRENRAGRRFCVHCGAGLELACPSCGARSEPGERFCGQCGTEVQVLDPESRISVPSSTQPPTPKTPAERRQLTVMFCDLVGSTALSAKLDPEELRAVVRAYQQAGAAVIDRYGGLFSQYLGDGLLVYFGYPVAHEDDAARAIRAGLEIVANVGPGHAVPLHVRIGIHTGLVVVGEMGRGDKREQLALGETPNIAARVQGLAAAGSVVISATTQRLIAGLFECQDLGPQTLKGISTPLSVYQVVGEGPAQSRFEVAMQTGLTPLVGR